MKDLDLVLAAEKRETVDDRQDVVRGFFCIGSGGGTISLIDKAPHPNAAKLFVNWLLSREGQLEFQKRNGSDSLRTDIPKQNVLPENRRLAGVDYFDGDDPKFSDRRPADKLLNEILSKTGGR